MMGLGAGYYPVLLGLNSCNFRRSVDQDVIHRLPSPRGGCFRSLVRYPSSEHRWKQNCVAELVARERAPVEISYQHGHTPVVPQ